MLRENAEYFGGIKSACCETNFGSILGIYQRDADAISWHDSNDKAMKGMLMKVITASQGEHLPHHSDVGGILSPFSFPIGLPSLFPSALPLQLRGIIVEIILFISS